MLSLKLEFGNTSGFSSIELTFIEYLPASGTVMRARDIKEQVGFRYLQQNVMRTTVYMFSQVTLQNGNDYFRF